MAGLFTIKSLDDVIASANGENALKKVLGPLQITLLGIGAIIGAGIFATIGTAAAGDLHRLGAGPSLMLSFVVAALVCAFAAFCYAEFASMVPISGSAYTYAYATLGELVAWIIGWDLIIEYAVGNVAVAISWANYFKTLLKEGGINVPDWISTDFGTARSLPGVLENAPHLFGIPIVFNFLAFAIVAAITVVLLIGIRESARFNATMVILKLLVLAFFVWIGFHHVSPANWTPFQPNGWKGTFAGAAVIFFAFIGFDAVSTVAEEAKNPKRDLPIGIIGSLVICTVIYVVVAAVFTGMISYRDLVKLLGSEQAEPLTAALTHANLHGFVIYVVALGSVIAHTAVLLVFQLGQPRIFFSMARDGLLPKPFARVHPKYGTPWFSTILCGLGVGGAAMFSSLDEMVDLTNIGTLFAFILVCIGIVILRYREPDRPRAFRVPGGALMPLLGVVGCLGLIYYLPPTSWLRFASWLNIGFLIYVAYGSKHSLLTGEGGMADKSVHRAVTAYRGAWLGIFGSLMITVACLADTLRPDAVKSPDWWFPQTGWLIVPLILNIVILCPSILGRAWTAKKSGVKGESLALANRALWLGGLQLIAMCVYLAAGLHR